MKTSQPHGDYMCISIRAHEVTDNRNGTYTVIMPSRSLDPDDLKVIERLFPNLGENVHHLLTQEALLASLATPAEVMAKATKEKY